MSSGNPRSLLLVRERNRFYRDFDRSDRRRRSRNRILSVQSTDSQGLPNPLDRYSAHSSTCLVSNPQPSTISPPPFPSVLLQPQEESSAKITKSNQRKSLFEAILNMSVFLTCH